MSATLRRAGVVLALAACLAPSPAGAEERFYRYENGEGVTVIDDHVPPQFAPKGYAILSGTGRVIEVIPRALTAAEREDTNGEVVKARLRREEEEKQRHFDETLLTRYSSFEDITAGRTRRINEIIVRIEMTKGSIANLKGQLEARQQEAADLERAGREVPKEYTDTIEALRGEIGAAEELLARLGVEQQANALRFDLEVRRFGELRPDLVSPRAPDNPP
ncbi:MAG: hypothetical protein ACKPE6_09020 [Gammaproteobacteria bacterium]